MKKFKILSLGVILVSLFYACEQKEISDPILQEAIVEPTQKQLDKLHKMGVNTDDVVIEKIPSPLGVSEEYLVSGDIAIPVDQLDNYVDLKIDETQEKQFRSDFIVSKAYRNIRVLGWTGSGYDLTPRMRTALSWAIANYNVLSTTLNFTLSFGTDQSNADLVVYRLDHPNGPTVAGGRAGFPAADGKPYRYARIYSGTDSPSYSTNLIEHVIGHEIGHCIGLRHQDWSNRWSCGPFSPESPAICIPGTPCSPYEPSIMRACFNGSEDGELTDSDKFALDVIY